MAWAVRLITRRSLHRRSHQALVDSTYRSTLAMRWLLNLLGHMTYRRIAIAQNRIRISWSPEPVRHVDRC